MKATHRPGRVLILLPLIALLSASALAVSSSAGEESEKSGWLGVYLQRLTPDLREALDLPSDVGVLVKKVAEDSPAEKAGLQMGDVILKYDNKTVTSPGRLSRLIRKTSPGEKVKVRISRHGQEKTLTVEIGEREEEEEESYTLYGDFDLSELPDIICHWLGPDLWLGIRTVDLTDQLAKYFGIEDGRGVLISEVLKNSPAEDAGLKAGDVIFRADGERIDDTPDLHEVMDRHEEGEEMKLVVIRQGKEKKLTVILEEPPSRFKRGLAKKLQVLPQKLRRMKTRAPCHDLETLPVERGLPRGKVLMLERRLDRLQEELDRIKEKLEMD